MTESKMTIFDILRSVSYDKSDLSQQEGFDEAYTPFMVNRFLSMAPDTIFLAEFMNKMSHLPARLQYHFYMGAIDKKRRFFKYAKGKEDVNKENLKLVMLYYDVNDVQGKEILKLLNDEQLQNIKNTFTEQVIRGD